MPMKGSDESGRLEQLPKVEQIGDAEALEKFAAPWLWIGRQIGQLTG